MVFIVISLCINVKKKNEYIFPERKIFFLILNKTNKFVIFLLVKCKHFPRFANSQML